MYAITGITGKVGGALARTLLAAGLPVRAVVRDAERAAPWAALGCWIDFERRPDDVVRGHVELETVLRDMVSRQA